MIFQSLMNDVICDWLEIFFYSSIRHIDDDPYGQHFCDRIGSRYNCPPICGQAGLANRLVMLMLQ